MRYKSEGWDISNKLKQDVPNRSLYLSKLILISKTIYFLLNKAKTFEFKTAFNYLDFKLESKNIAVPILLSFWKKSIKSLDVWDSNPLICSS